MTIIIATDGACANNQHPSERQAGFGFVIALDEEVVHETSDHLGSGEEYTNNVAEYEAAIRATRWVARNLDADERRVCLRTDSQLMINQTRGDWDTHDDQLRQRRDALRRVLAEFEEVTMNQTGDGMSDLVARADNLAKGATNNK